MNTWPQVDKLEDQELLDSKTLNRPVDQLAARTDYLKRRLGSILEDGVQSSVVLSDVALLQDEHDTLKVGDVVYRTKDGFRKAQAKMHLCDDFTADDSAFAIGILISMAGEDIGSVLIYGKLDSVNMVTANVEGMLEEDEEFRDGRYYLSATEPGKITSRPNGPLIYIGSFYKEGDTDSVAYINPQFLDIGTSHVHRAYTLVSRPAGDVFEESVIGHLPIAYLESDSSSTSDSSSSSPERSHLPSLIFGGTWTSVNDVNYVFTLGNNGSWGNVELSWYKNGNSASYKTVKIPAPGVFVNIDNGLKVKIDFPEATKDYAYQNLSVDERKWVLRFPEDGKGWVNHSTEAIASVDGTEESSSESSSSNDDTVTPTLNAVLSGSWPENDNRVGIVFPASVYERTFTSSDTTVKIGENTYEFVQEGQSPTEGNIAVKKAATVTETLSNLSEVANSMIDDPSVFVLYNTLVTCDAQIDSLPATYTYSGQSFQIVGGTIPIMVVYDRYYSLIGDVVTNKPTFVPFSADGLEISLYAPGATSTNNYYCQIGTRMSASAYDYAPDSVYDYVMGLHQEVDYYFPPVPAAAAGLFVNGVEMENAELFIDNPTYKLGGKTIHWMSNAKERLPWPDDITSRNGYVIPEYDKTMTFYFVVGFQCSTGPVTSLVPAPGSQIKLYTYGTNDRASTGDLMIDAAIDMEVVDGGEKGYNVAKRGRGGHLIAGPVVERIKAGNGISITQSSGCPEGQGTVTISLEDGSRRGTFNEIALENAKQEKIGLFPYISLLGWGSSANIPSAFTVMMRVPSNLENIKYSLDLRMVMFGTVAYSSVTRMAAGIQLEYNILPDYTDTTSRSLKTGLLVPDSARSIAVPLGHKVGNNWVYTAYDPFVATTEVNSDTETPDVRVPFSSYPIPLTAEFSLQPSVIPELRPGYLVALRIARSGLPTGQSYLEYTGPLGFLNMEWTLKEAQ